MEHRDILVQRAGKSTVGKMVQDLMITGGSIIDMGYTDNSFRPEKVQYWSVTFRVVFPDRDSMEDFHSLGWITKPIPRTIERLKSNDDE